MSAHTSTADGRLRLVTANAAGNAVRLAILAGSGGTGRHLIDQGFAAAYRAADGRPPARSAPGQPCPSRARYAKQAALRPHPAPPCWDTALAPLPAGQLLGRELIDVDPDGTRLRSRAGEASRADSVRLNGGIRGAAHEPKIERASGVVHVIARSKPLERGPGGGYER